MMGIRTALSAGNDIMALNAMRGGPFIKTMQERGLRAAIDERNASGAPTARRRCSRDD